MREPYLSSTGMIKSPSEVSLLCWDQEQVEIKDNLNIWRHEFPIATQTIKALLFIKTARPALREVPFLKEHRLMIQHLANAFHNINAPQALSALDNLIGNTQEVSSLLSMLSLFSNANTSRAPASVTRTETCCCVVTL
jgi:hypothetical protein